MIKIWKTNRSRKDKETEENLEQNFSLEHQIKYDIEYQQ